MKTTKNRFGIKDERSDSVLLGEFVESGSEDSFHGLVNRYSGMVYNVCYRQLVDSQDAEDAAQAVFLLLWKKASTLRNRETIGGWLHRAALNVCRNAWKAKQVRLQKESEVIAMKEHEKDVYTNEWELIKEHLDVEIEKLSDKYRIPLILFHLEGRSHDEIGALLGLKRGTVAQRLKRAREQLHRRLVGKGIALGLAAFAALLAEKASASAVPPDFGVSTTASVAKLAAGKLDVGSATQAALAESAASAMKLASVKQALAWSFSSIAVVSAVVLVYFYINKGEVENTADTSSVSIDKPIENRADHLPHLSVSGTTFFIDQNHPNADDLNIGTDADFPWRTIGRSIGSVKPGDTVFVAGGRYQETLRPQNSGEQGQPVTWRTHGPEPVILAPINNNEAVGIDLEKLRYITIAGFTIERFGRGVRIIECQHIGLRDCTVRNIGKEAVVIRNSSRCLIADNRIHNTGLSAGAQGAGITIDSLPDRGRHTYRIQVRRNEIYATSAEAIEIGSNASKCQIESNIIRDIALDKGGAIHIAPPNGEAYSPDHLLTNNLIARISTRNGDKLEGNGIRLASGTGVLNNVIFDCQHHGIRIDGTKSNQHIMRIWHNTIYQTGEEPIGLYDNEKTIESRIIGNLGSSLPGNLPAKSTYFVNPENSDFRLVSGSAPIDAVPQVLVQGDFDRSPRPIGSAPDFGAYEFQP